MNEELEHNQYDCGDTYDSNFPAENEFEDDGVDMDDTNAPQGNPWRDYLIRGTHG